MVFFSVFVERKSENISDVLIKINRVIDNHNAKKVKKKVKITTSFPLHLKEAEKKIFENQNIIINRTSSALDRQNM